MTKYLIKVIRSGLKGVRRLLNYEVELSLLRSEELVSSEETLVFQAIFSAEGIRNIEAILQKSGLANYKDVHNNALAVFGWCVEKVSEGKPVGCVNKETGIFTELGMPVFDSIQAKIQKPSIPKKPELKLVYSREDRYPIAPE